MVQTVRQLALSSTYRQYKSAVQTVRQSPVGGTDSTAVSGTYGTAVSGADSTAVSGTNSTSQQYTVQQLALQVLP